MTEQQFRSDVETIIANMTAIKEAKGVLPIMSQLPDYPVETCACAAAIMQLPKAFVLVAMNKQHRDAAISFAYDSAIQSLN